MSIRSANYIIGPKQQTRGILKNQDLSYMPFHVYVSPGVIQKPSNYYLLLIITKNLYQLCVHSLKLQRQVLGKKQVEN